MDTLIFAAILLLNVCISIWNCYAVGTAWKDTMAMGGGFLKAVLYSAVVQSAIGFSLPILLLLAWIATKVLGLPGTDDAGNATPPAMSPQDIAEFWQAIFSLWYVAVILPCLGSGFIITAHSIRIAYQRRDFGSIAAAGWNSFAQIYNTVDAVRNLGGAWGNVAEFVGKGLSAGGDGKDSGKAKAVILLFVLVIVALMLGTMIAVGLVRYFANQTESRLEQYGRRLQAA